MKKTESNMKKILTPLKPNTENKRDNLKNPKEPHQNLLKNPLKKLKLKKKLKKKLPLKKNELII